MVRSGRIIIFALLSPIATLATESEPVCSSPSDCADDEVPDINLLQRAVVFDNRPESLSVPNVKRGHRGGLRARQRVADPAFLLEGALSAGLPWTLDDAVKRVGRINGTYLGLLQGVDDFDHVVDGYKNDNTPFQLESRFATFKKDCKSMNSPGYSGCGGSLANILGSTSKVFFSGETLTLQDAYNFGTEVAIETLNNVLPLVGMVATIASSLISSSLFPETTEDPYMKAMNELADLVLEEATRVATNNLLSSTITDYSSEMRAVAEDLDFLPQLLSDQESNPDANLTLFNFNLVMLHEISKLGGKIRDGELASIANNQWSFEIFAIAVEVAQLEVVLLMQIANHSLVDKMAINARLQQKMFGTGGWADWFDEHLYKATDYIKDEFDKCNLDPRISLEEKPHYAGRYENGRFTYTCTANQNSDGCKTVMGSLNLFDSMGTCKSFTSKQLCKDSNLFPYQSACNNNLCPECKADYTKCPDSQAMCTNCHRDAVRNKLLNSFEDLALQWRGLFTSAGGYGHYRKYQFTEHRGKQACAGSSGHCNPITSAGRLTFSDCWEECFSRTDCVAIEHPKCSDHSKRVSVLETGYDGWYFMVDWNSWMGSSDKTTKTARQCRGGRQVWMGVVRIWDSQWWDHQTKGTSHGRKHPEASQGDWQVGDTIYPEEIHCGQEECGSKCRDHSKMLNVQDDHQNGKYFNVDWMQWMTDDGTSSGPGRILSVRQCRDGGEVWVGSVKVFNSVASSNGQTVGDTHGRRSDGEREGQWQAGDKIYPSIYRCEVQECTCKLVTGLGDLPLTFRPLGGNSVFTTKVHDESMDSCS